MATKKEKKTHLSVNEKARKLIKESEGLRLVSYYDLAGVLTIGYGHTGKDVTYGMKITEDEAEKLFEKDLEKFSQGVAKRVLVDINENQFSALVSFAYNVGLGALQGSTLLKLLNEGKDCSNEFGKWIRSDGRVLPGLIKRRELEKKLFLS